MENCSEFLRLNKESLRWICRTILGLQIHWIFIAASSVIGGFVAGDGFHYKDHLESVHPEDQKPNEAKMSRDVLSIRVT